MNGLFLTDVPEVTNPVVPVLDQQAAVDNGLLISTYDAPTNYLRMGLITGTVIILLAIGVLLIKSKKRAK